MQTSAQTIRNVTGVASAPDRAREMVQGTEEFGPTSEGSAEEIAKVRASYAQLSEGLGSVPPPVMEKPATRGGDGFYKLVDKLGQRLAFERGGVRLYEALISKYEAYGSFEGGPSLDELEEMRSDEHDHLHLLSTVITELGGDPTALTPSADLQTTASRGIVDVLVDPRTTFAQSLEAMLTAELTDGAGWEMLRELAIKLGEDELAERFKAPEETERRHLHRVKHWLSNAAG